MQPTNGIYKSNIQIYKNKIAYSIYIIDSNISINDLYLTENVYLAGNQKGASRLRVEQLVY